VRNEIILSAPAEFPSRLLISELTAPEFHVSRPQAIPQTSEAAEFWERRKQRHAEEAAECGSASAYQALVKHALDGDAAHEALEYLREAERRGVTSPALEIARLQVMCRLDPGNVRGELERLGERGSLNIKEPDVLADLARAFLALNERATARRFLERVLISELTEGSLAALVSELWWGIGQDGEAWKAAQQATSLDEEQVRAWNVLGCVSVRQGEYERAREFYARALEHSPLFRPALLNDLVLRTNYFGDRPEFDQAERYLEAYPRDLEFAYRIAVHARDFGDWKMLRRLWQKVDDAGRTEDAALRIGFMLFASDLGAADRNERAAKAARLGNLLDRLSADTPHAALDAANWLARRAPSAEAAVVIATLEQKCGQVGWLGSALRGLAQYARDAGHAGLEEIEIAVKANPEHMILSRLALCLYFDAARHADAADVAEHLLKSDMSCLVDWNNAIYADLMANRVRKAEEKWRVVERRPAWQRALKEQFYMRATQGLLLIRRGEVEDGARLYEEAQKMAPDELQRNRVAQKRSLEIGRALLARADQRAQACLEEAAQGPDAVYGADARALLSNAR